MVIKAAQKGSYSSRIRSPYFLEGAILLLFMIKFEVLFKKDQKTVLILEARNLVTAGRNLVKPETMIPNLMRSSSCQIEACSVHFFS